MFRVSLVIAALLWLSAEARAQEDLEPRTVGGAGITSVGLSASSIGLLRPKKRFRSAPRYTWT